MMGNMNLITTIIGFGMSSMFIVFVCTRLICGRLWRSESRPVIYRGQHIIDLEQPEQRMTNGLESAVVAAIPTMKFHRDAFSCVEDAQCSICLGEYQEKEILRIMPKCGHNFHLSCIDIWLTKQSTCPVCRLPLKHPPDKNSARFVSFDDNHEVEHSMEHLDQSLVPGSDHSAGDDTSQRHNHATFTIPEANLAGESVPRLTLRG